MLFEVRPSVFGAEEPDHELRQAILDRLPTQIEGLRMRREEAAKPKRKRKPRRESSVVPVWISDPNPWVLYIVGGLITVVVGAWIVTLIFGS